MTIKELCEKYKCNLTAMYNKLKRKEKELEGHIVIRNGVIQIDEYAEEILKPGERQREMKALIEKGKGVDWELERARGKYEIEIAKRKEAEYKVEELQVRIESLETEISGLKARNGDLLAQVLELEQRLSESERKHSVLFGRR